MIAVDTNILVYAHRTDSPFHDRAREAIESVASAARPWAIPWPCVHEFVAIVTNLRIYRTPTPLEIAFTQLRALGEIERLSFIGESDDSLPVLEELSVAAKVQGAMIHDARIAAICRSHGVDELWSADRDFSRFPGLKTHNPLLA